MSLSLQVLIRLAKTFSLSGLTIGVVGGSDLVKISEQLGKTGMGEEFPKRLFAAGAEPLVGHVNNSCRVTLLGKIKDALKFIECHLHGLDMSLIDDQNIRPARMKIAFDLWNAANDPVFIERMSKYEPTKFDSPLVDIE